MSDTWMRNRARGPHRDGGPAEGEAPPPAALAPPQPRESPDGSPVGGVQQAMQMLTLAQRTADQHVASAQRQAEQIQAEARTQADKVVGAARAQAESVRAEADRVLADAQAAAARVAQESEARAATAREEHDRVVAEAGSRATKIVEDAEAKAKDLDHRAQLRYEEMVGNLGAKREDLQRQIESLQEFDRDYRAKLLAFLQAQVRALWADEAKVDGDLSGGPEPTPDAAASDKPPAKNRAPWPAAEDRAPTAVVQDRPSRSAAQDRVSARSDRAQTTP